MPKQFPPKTQKQKFIQTAKELNCDESEENFKKKLTSMKVQKEEEKKKLAN